MHILTCVAVTLALEVEVGGKGIRGAVVRCKARLEVEPLHCLIADCLACTAVVFSGYIALIGGSQI